MNNAIKHFIIPFALLALMMACGDNNNGCANRMQS